MGTLYLNRPEPDEESFEVRNIVVRDDYTSSTGKANLALLEVRVLESFKVYIFK